MGIEPFKRLGCLFIALTVTLFSSLAQTSYAAKTELESWSGTFSNNCGSEEICPPLAPGHSSDELVAATITIDPIDEPIDERFPNIGNIRIRVTPLQSICSQVAIGAKGSFNGQPNWIVTLSPPNGYWENGPANKTQEQYYTIEEGTWNLPIYFWAQPGCYGGFGTPTAAYSLKLQITWVNKGTSGPTLKVPGENVDNMHTQRSVGFSGKGWNRKGGPITVRFGGHVVERFKPSRRFNGDFDLSDFPIKSPKECAGALTATQGGVTRKVDVKGTVERYYYYAKDVFFPNRRPIKRGSILCKGLNPRMKRNHVAVYKERVDDPYTGLTIDDRPGGVRATRAYLFGSPNASIDLGIGGGRRVKIHPDTDVGPSVNVGQLLDLDDPNLITIIENQVSWSRIRDYSNLFSPHDLTFTYDLELMGGKLYTRGNLRVNDDMFGSGRVFVTQDLTVRGMVRVNGMGIVTGGVLRVG